MERYCYFSSNFISAPELRGGYKFAHDLALQERSRLTICVNSIRVNQFIEKIFDDKVTVNKLGRYQTITDNSVNVQLKSPRGIDAYSDYGVVLALHSSPEAIEKLESVKKLNTLIVVAEIPLDGTCRHLEEWAKQYQVKRLTPGEK